MQAGNEIKYYVQDYLQNSDDIVEEQKIEEGALELLKGITLIDKK